MNDQGKAVNLNERQNRIMEIMQQQNAVSVSSLASMLKVSEVTIRKDLSILENQHFLYRIHGSAILVNRYINDRSMDEKKLVCAEEKRAIGKYAASLVVPRDTIMITSGTTTQAFANEISMNDSLTVITSTFGIASILATKSNIEVLQLGGIVRESSMSVLGPFAEQMLSTLSCSKLFLGVDGVDTEWGLTTTNHMEAHLHRIMADSAQKVIVLADHTKFNRRGYSQICGLDRVDQIITDDGTSPNIIGRLRDAGIDVSVVSKDGLI